MSLYGTQQKCKVCEKTVYPMELLSADGVDFHKSCFRCTHCKGTLKLGNYSSMEGVLYCKPHFEQLFKETGNYNKNFQSAAKSADKVTPELTRTPSKAAGMFSGTQEKCATCGKTAYPLEKISVFDGTPIDCGSYSSTNKETSIDENILEFPVHPKAIRITKRRRKEKVSSKAYEDYEELKVAMARKLFLMEQYNNNKTRELELQVILADTTKMIDTQREIHAKMLEDIKNKRML